MIVIVTGPPCGGKSTYAWEHLQDGDLLIDMDEIAKAIEPMSSSHDYSDVTRNVARAARNAAVREVVQKMQGERRRRAFIIHTDPSPEMRRVYRAMGGRFVEMDPGKEECLRRAKNRPPKNQQLVRQVIDEWYGNR